MKNDFAYTLAFESLRRPTIERLIKLDPQKVAQNSGAKFDADKKQFTIESFHKTITVTYPEYDVIPESEDQIVFSTILQYLEMSDGTLPTGEIIPFADIKDGMVRGGNLDRRAEADISKIFSGCDHEKAKKIFDTLSGEYLDSNADFCVVFRVFPHFPITLKVWLADDEFPASGRLFADKTAEHNMTAEGAVVTGEALIELIKHIYETL